MHTPEAARLARLAGRYCPWAGRLSPTTRAQRNIPGWRGRVAAGVPKMLVASGEAVRRRRVIDDDADD